MKRSYLFLCGIVILSMAVSPAGINVTSPNAASKWDVGKTYNITWNSPNCPGGQVKINIFKNSIVQSNFVEQLVVANTGSTSWKVPTGYAAGNYQIRIKSAVNNECLGDSPVFEIKGLQVITTIMIPKENLKLPSNTPQNIPLIQFPDFHIYKITHSVDNYLVILFENFGASYSGDLKLFYKIKGVSSVFSRHVSISKGMRSMFPTDRLLTAADLNDDGQSIGVHTKIDWNGTKGDIMETSETNNDLYQSIRPDLGIPDYNPNDLTFEVLQRSTQPRHLPKGRIKVRIKNLNSSYEGFITVQVFYKFEGENGYPHALIPKTFQIALNNNEQKWVTMEDMWWPVRDTTTKSMINYKAVVTPASGNPEVIKSNNEYVRGWLHPDGPF